MGSTVCDDLDIQERSINPIHDMDSDQLVSAMTLADRDQDYETFVVFRREVMYRLRCAEPLVNWTKPTRLGKK